MNNLPTKLSKDAILEVNFEIRFEPKSNIISEFALTKLAEPYVNEGFEAERLPISEFPPFVIERDINLQRQPQIRLSSKDSPFRVSIGRRVYNFSVVGEYCGWDTLSVELKKFVQFFFDCNLHRKIERLGLRYVNSLTAEGHFIYSMQDLNLELKVADELLEGPISLTFAKQLSDTVASNCRIVSSGFIQGDMSQDAVVIVDIDVSTPQEQGFEDVDEVLHWIEVAHEKEKLQFFSILPDNIVEKLRVS